MTANSVTAVVVTHQGSSGVVGRCLDAVRSAGGCEHVIVVDNSGGGAASHHDTPVPTPLHDTVWLQTSNEGYGAAVNLGIAEARQRWGDGQHIAVLNDDTRVAHGWLDPLVSALAADARVGAVQPKLLIADSVPVRVNSVGVELDAAGAGSDLGFGEVDGLAWHEPREIATFTAGAVLFRLEFLRDTGGFDERYFLYYEDVDLALRGAELGWRYRCEPSSIVEHWPGSTSAQIGDELRRLQERNRLWTAFRFGSPRLIGAALWLSVRRLRHEPRRTHARALLDGVVGAPKRLIERAKARSR